MSQTFKSIKQVQCAMQDNFQEGKNLTLNTKSKTEITNSDDKQLHFTGKRLIHVNTCKH